jgi:hypothetical protein
MSQKIAIKKNYTSLGKVEIAKDHLLACGLDKFAISHRLQSVICLTGQSQVFEDGEKLLRELMGIEMSGKQIQRVSEHYGNKIEALETSEHPTVPPLLGKNNEKAYVMIDGSMLFTREEKWKEIKLGRIFCATNRIAVQPTRTELTKSQYVSHLGGHKEFQEKMDRYIEPYQHKIIIADGAKWIWNWVEDSHPKAVQILDYFHAVEKISEFAATQWSDKNERTKWINTQEAFLLNDQVDQVISILQNIESTNSKAEILRTSTLRYYQNNKNRMYYKTYKNAGLLIGSGAIESAHRNIVQQRLKLSGQRWSIYGAQQIVNLRAFEKSNRWNEVVNIIENAA